MRWILTFLYLGFAVSAQDLGGDVISSPPADDRLQEVLPGVWEWAKREYEGKLAEMARNGSGVSNAPSGCPLSGGRQRRGAKTTSFSEEFDVNSNIFELAVGRLEAHHNISRRQVSGTPAQCTNPSTSHCGSFTGSKFRTADGTCNNVNNPFWGAVNRPFNRLLQNAYEDGVNAPRGGINSRLQNPRVISTRVHPDSTVVNQRLTNMVPQFGQFLDHDITMTPEANSACCQNPSSNANCWAIFVGGDSFYSQFTNCLDFTRSTPCIRSGIREQMNANTAFIDGSQIYGSSLQRANSLRTFSGGMLRTNANFRGFLPTGSQVGIQTQGDFAAGDDRVNENPGLAVSHNIWIMEHNRIAQRFQQITAWNDERIYQETRRIVIAELQQVTYKEYLPVILGPGAMNEYSLDVSTWSTYNPSVDPTIVNEFSTAAYRFGHSMVPGVFNLMNAQNSLAGSYRVADEFFQSRQITQFSGQGYDMILRGLMQQNPADFDRFVTSGLTNFLFRPQNQAFGSDLVARNIQRGRDHGLRPYNDYRVSCGGSSLASATWATAPPGINPEGWARAAQVYQSPMDIDLFVGGLLELPVSGGVSGSTFTCLKALQFSRLKFGDRYFFTHSQSLGFTAAQLTDLTKRKYSDIICDNSQQPDAPTNVFLATSASNPSISCTGRPQLDLNNYLV